MNKKEVLEIRKQFSPENCAITRICGCYVDHEKEKKMEMKKAFLSLPEEEAFKYFDIFKHTLSGTIGKNLINMKIPCAVNARDIVGAKTGTPENEIISTLSIATASLVTIVILALGVMLLIPLQPVLQSPALLPAFDNVVPALFGAMAYKYYRKNMKIALWPLVLMSVLFILVPGLLGSTSFMILPSGAIAIGVAYFRYRRSRKETAA